jgi:hypothetical protein
MPPAAKAQPKTENKIARIMPNVSQRGLSAAIRIDREKGNFHRG